MLRYITRKLLSFIGFGRYRQVPLPILLVSIVAQKIFRLNAKVPFLVHYSSHVVGGNIILGSEVELSFAVSANLSVAVHRDTTLRIGDRTIIAPHVAIRTANHGLLDRKSFVTGDVVIGENCWIGFGAVILPGVVLGDNVTVGAGAVVTKSFKANSVIGGVPAKLIKEV
ncbi:acyltransferase [Roseiconus lacunae]|uniref:acyltransferase n=1 Tax=Roseiconus lacunae TaxID=2605694 RepID=UPI0011F3D101